MPLINSFRFAAPAGSVLLSGGTQYVEGALAFAGATTIVLADAVYPATGNYVLFDYSAGSFPGGQAALNSNVAPYVDASNLTLSSVDTVTGGTAVVEDDTVNKQVILKLISKPTNGTQYVEGNLTILPTLTIVLSSTLYATAGTYVLFEVTGTIAAGSESNINLSLPAGRSVVSGPTIVGNQIKVTLA